MDMIIRRTRISDEQPLQDIGISDGRIVAIEEAIEQRADQEIDAEDASRSPDSSNRISISKRLSCIAGFRRGSEPSTKPFVSPAS